ncbi:MAG: hypothetical protein IH609_17670 [Dehalococcoidia bacterium]|nr:hypothetical protein [Dehalococcoidia bacterium]
MLDSAFEDGREDAYLQLVHHLLRKANDCGRDRPTVWLDREPEVASALADHYSVTPEVRSLQCSLENGLPPAKAEKPFVDLAYW